jgi:hypothetical protein
VGAVLKVERGWCTATNGSFSGDWLEQDGRDRIWVADKIPQFRLAPVDIAALHGFARWFAPLCRKVMHAPGNERMAVAAERYLSATRYLANVKLNEVDVERCFFELVRVVDGLLGEKDVMDSKKRFEHWAPKFLRDAGCNSPVDFEAIYSARCEIVHGDVSIQLPNLNKLHEAVGRLFVAHMIATDHLGGRSAVRALLKDRKEFPSHLVEAFRNQVAPGWLRHQPSEGPWIRDSLP